MANISDLEKSAIFAEEDFVIEAQTFLHALMQEKGLSRADLARAMGVTRARITQIFSDECKNFTVRLLARAIHALGESPSLVCKRDVKGALDAKRIQILDMEDIEKVWDIKAALTDVKKLVPCNDQAPTRLSRFDYSPLEWEAA